MVLTKSIPSEGLEPGDVGTVVHMYRDLRPTKSNFSRSTAAPPQWQRSNHLRCDPSARVT
jgi:hypothetical protein